MSRLSEQHSRSESANSGILVEPKEVFMAFRPLHDRVLIRRVESEEKTAGGIIIPDTAKEKPMEGEVVAAGRRARRGWQASTDGSSVGRSRPVRQMVGHRGQARWRRADHHERVRRHGRDRARNPRQKSRLRSTKIWQPRKSDFTPMLASGCCAASILSLTR